MSDEIQFEESDGRGRYFVAMPNGEAAELTFVRRGANHLAVDHTFVPRAYRGGGVAARLMLRAVEDARAAGTKITPYCAFAVSEFRRHKDWADVLDSPAAI